VTATVADTGLLVVPARIGADKPLNLYVVVGRSSWVWVDAGIASTPDDHVLPYLDAHDLRPPETHLLLVTHCDVDHFGGATALRRRFPGLAVLAHAADADAIENRRHLMERRYRMHRERGVDPPPERQRQLDERGGPAVRVDLRLRGLEALGDGGDWQVLCLPGHSPGSIGVWHPGRRTAIVGDAVLGWGLRDTAGRLVTPPPYYDVDAYLGTVARLEGLGLEELCTSHFGVLRGDRVGAFLAECREAVGAIGAAVADLAPDVPLPEACRAVAARLSRWPAGVEAGLADAVVAHRSRRPTSQ
jgi:glyoxylase-like metal-dependent hydrolase (beta-lactamase superfamily II)